MKYRKLRIAWSVGFGILCLLLIALWVRSYWLCDFVYYRPTQVTLYLASPRNGVIVFQDLSSRIGTIGNPPGVGWTGFVTGRQYSIEFSEASPLSKVFRGFARPNQVAWQVPAWFFVLVSAALAAASWLPWRFSLRTLLIGMTAAAIGLGLAVWALQN